MKEVRVEIRIRNNRLIKHREKLGLAQKMMAEVVGITLQQYAGLENLSISPVETDPPYGFTKYAIAVAECFEKNPKYLFSEAIKSVTKNKLVKEIGAIELMQKDALRLLGPDADIANRDTKKTINKALERLTPRERVIVSKYFGLNGNEEMTLKEISKITTNAAENTKDFGRVGICSARVNAILDKALRKLRSEQFKHIWDESLEVGYKRRNKLPMDFEYHQSPDNMRVDSNYVNEILEKLPKSENAKKLREDYPQILGEENDIR